MAEHRTHEEATRLRFDEAAASYDTQFVRFIGRYDEMHGVLVDLARGLRPEARRFLDLGTGTGEVARRVLEAFPSSTVHAVDISEGMVEQARAKLSSYGERFTCEVAGLADYAPRQVPPYDAVVSALAIHHLAHEDKRRLTLRACTALAPGGLFLNADLVNGETDLEREMLLVLYVESMRARGLSGEEIEERLRRHREHDIPATISDQTLWLKEAGCRDVFVPWRYLIQAIIVGIR